MSRAVSTVLLITTSVMVGDALRVSSWLGTAEKTTPASRGSQPVSPHRNHSLRSGRERDLVDVAPAPVLTGLGRADDRMAALARVRGCVLIRRGVAAPDLPAGHAHAQVDPAVADLQALLAPGDRLGQPGHLDLVEVAADAVRGHASPLVASSFPGARSVLRNLPRHRSTTTRREGRHNRARARTSAVGTSS